MSLTRFNPSRHLVISSSWWDGEKVYDDVVLATRMSGKARVEQGGQMLN